VMSTGGQATSGTRDTRRPRGLAQERKKQEDITMATSPGTHRRRYCLLVGVLALTGCTTLQLPWMGASDAQINRLLEQPVRLQLDGDANPAHNLSQFIEWLRQATGSDLRVQVNWAALRGAGASPITPIILTIERTTLAQALCAVLREVSADYEKDPIDYRIHEGLVLISTRRDLYATTNRTRIYNVRDVLVGLADYEDIPGYKPDSANADNRAASAAGAAHQAVVTHLIKIITETVGRPEDWTAGRIHEINGDLIITTTPQNHRQIKALLKDLRKSRKKGRKVLKQERQ